MEFNKHGNVCRTCMSANENLLSIFEIQISDRETVEMVDFISQLTSIEITKDDGLPQQLCVCCIDTVCKLYNFIQLCKDSDSSLRTRKNLVQMKQEEICIDEISSFNINEKDLEILEEVKVERPIPVDVLNTSEKDSNYECPNCKETFISKTKLAKHKLLHVTNASYECGECLKSFSKKMHLNVHMRSHVKLSDKQYICKVCGQKFSYLYLLKRHSFKHNEEKPFPCTKCKKGCLTAESLRRHMKIHEDDYRKKTHICTICGKEFEYPSFLAEHMKNHTGEKPFLCSICGKGYRQSGALAYHVRAHTGYKPYKCELCNTNFTSRGVLRVHMRRHTDERPYICDVCGVGFRQSTDMKRHQFIHSGDKRATCNICGKQLSTTGQLTVHLRTHTGEKPFDCDICAKAFTTRTMLVKHRRIHTGERPYICKVCGRSFNQSSTLKTHGMKHVRNITNFNSSSSRDDRPKDLEEKNGLHMKNKTNTNESALPAHIAIEQLQCM